MTQTIQRRSEQAAELLVSAYSTGRRLASLPPEIEPSNVEAAYAIQDASLRRLGRPGGWKTSVGRSLDVCSPIPASRFFVSPAQFDSAAWSSPRLEVELAVRLASDLAASNEQYNSNSVAAAIESIIPAFEVATSRFLDRTAVSPMSVVADLQNNEAVVWGEGVTTWVDIELADFEAELRIDGALSTEAAPRHQHSTAEVVASLAWLANHAIGRGYPLQAGNVILLGARLLPVPIQPGTTAVAIIKGIGRVEARF